MALSVGCNVALLTGSTLTVKVDMLIIIVNFSLWAENGHKSVPIKSLSAMYGRSDYL